MEGYGAAADALRRWGITARSIRPPPLGTMNDVFIVETYGARLSSAAIAVTRRNWLSSSTRSWRMLAKETYRRLEPYVAPRASTS